MSDKLKFKDYRDDYNALAADVYLTAILYERIGATESKWLALKERCAFLKTMFLKNLF